MARCGPSSASNFVTIPAAPAASCTEHTVGLL